MFCRIKVIGLQKFSLAAISLLIAGMAPSVIGEDFRLLLVRDGGVDEVSRLPTGRVTIRAGFLDGVTEGMSGTIWRKNKYKGELDIADFEIGEVTAYEAIATYVVRHPDFYLLKKDRVTLTPTVPTEAEILARAIKALDDGSCFQALLYFESIYCATLENAFVQQMIADCRTKVEASLAAAANDPEVGKKRRALGDLMELAERHHKFKNDLVADLYLKRILALDSSHAKATALRELVPVQDYAALLSPTRCEQK